MPAFKGGPALPKRSETISSPPTTSPTAAGKRKPVTTPLLSNPSDEIDTTDVFNEFIKAEPHDASSTIAGTDDDEVDVKPSLKVIDGSDVALPVSDIRSTAQADADEQDDEQEPPRKTRKTGSKESATPVKTEPGTPTKKGRANAAASSPSKSAPKTPPKKAVSAPTTPKSGEPASAWSAEHWDDLNFAILKVLHDHASELYDASPSLNPWRVKGRLLVKLRSMLKDAPGGEVASKRWDADKPTRGKNSPKKK
ncbi:hypothetical protein PSEUBRA_000564 [Kalmanozyma brasiliensis GHG001]|uniref:Uncharacterized protein n=1 Tax=Kalmanozyma brasiliensis (strain GHG001) TaxID=1365824 RepID=V5GW87_KALBG|nr:uncharacterized protein PSEUBRA_000564 [Kalmanozyma brasiliensis GHG001]EST10152.1 hypothetical protein PSEUBRA_000564 [Kalmanozyma brasiliensis GHG001]